MEIFLPLIFFLIQSSFFSNILLPSKIILPPHIFDISGNNCIIDKQVSDLPLPDSPTIPSISPFSTSMHTSLSTLAWYPNPYRSKLKFSILKILLLITHLNS